MSKQTDTTHAQAQAAAKEQLVIANEWFNETQGFVITSSEDQELVAGILRDVKARYKLIEEKRKEITVPLNQALKAVNDLFRPARERFEEIEKNLKEQIAGYLERKEVENAEAYQVAASASTAEEAVEALSTFASVAPPAGVSVRYVWKFEVINPEMVPAEFCSPDPDKIKAYVASTAGEPAIPGVWFTKAPVVTSRAR